MITEEIKVERVSEQDINEIVILHCKVFENYFLKNLGLDLVNKYYQAYYYDKGTIFLKASYKNEIIGFILVTSNYSNIIKNFYKDNFFSLSQKIVIETLKMNRTIFSGLKSRIVNVFKTSKEANVEEEENCLLSIAIVDSFRGKKIADLLIGKVEMQLNHEHVKAYSLSVKKDNIRAKNFYKKIGFEKIGGKGELEYYTKKLNFREDE